MVRDFWEFLDKRVKAQVIFGAVLTGVVIIIAIPYFVTVLNNRQPGATTEINDYTEVEAKEETNNDNEVVAEETKETETTEAIDESNSTSESNESYAYYAPAKSSSASTQKTSQPAAAAQTTSATEKVTRTTVDDRSAGDDGYTASGVDDPGANETMSTNEVTSDEN